MKVSHEDFVVAWATAMDLGDVAAATGLKEASVKARAKVLRDRGVNLPRLRSRGRQLLDDLDIARLNSLIKKHNRSDRGRV